MTRPKIVSGARVLVYINGKLFGVCTGFSWNSLTPRKKIRGIDIANVLELAATTTEVTWTMSVLRTIGDGGMQGQGVVVLQPSLSLEKYFTILLIERMSNLPIFRCDLNNTDSESWNVFAKNLMQGQIQGSGIIWDNEANQNQ